MEDKINKRLEELYKRQAHLTDKDRVWLPERNAPSRNRQIEDNTLLIRELETLLGNIL